MIISHKHKQTAITIQSKSENNTLNPYLQHNAQRNPYIKASLFLMQSKFDWHCPGNWSMISGIV